MGGCREARFLAIRRVVGIGHKKTGTQSDRAPVLDRFSAFELERLLKGVELRLEFIEVFFSFLDLIVKSLKFGQFLANRSRC